MNPWKTSTRIACLFCAFSLLSNAVHATTTIRRLDVIESNVNPAAPKPGPETETANWTSNPVVGRKKIFIIAGNSHILCFNRRISRIAISDPEAADALLLETNEVLINTKKQGAANLLVWD